MPRRSWPHGADHRGRLLLVALEAARLRADVHPLPALRSWLDSWRGIGDVARGMARQAYDLQLTRNDERGWRAIFCTTGMEHSPAERHRHGMGAHPLARDAAGSVGEALNQQRVE